MPTSPRRAATLPKSSSSTCSSVAIAASVFPAAWASVREIDEQRDVVGAPLDRLLDRVRRVLDAALGEQAVGEVAPGVGILRIDARCLLEPADGIVVAELDARLAGEAQQARILRARLQQLERRLAAASKSPLW